MNEQVNQSLSYRPDIDGLRAIAVLAVVFYHYGIGGLSGGFVGVDIFFVISGYLITGIIQKEIERGSFTFSGFYERRIRRIFPALFAMLLVTLVVGAWLLLPSDLMKLGNSTLSTLFFGSNVLFWRQSGYFDTSSEFNPLLHTWSLAVEEQFYIGLPVLLILLHRYAKDWLKPILIGCAIVSFALCVWMQALRPSATFFLSPFRAWELLLGGLLAVGAVPPMANRPLREMLSVLALVALLWSLWWIKAGPAFPGWQAAIPVVAAAILLHAGAYGDSQVKRLLSLRPLAFIGLVSYSLYLWHWPLLVFVRYRNGMQPLAPHIAWLLFAVALLLAIASYRWVETPMRQRKRTQGFLAASRKRVFTLAAVACVLLGGVAIASRMDHGWRARFSPEVVALDAARNPVIPFKECDGRVPDFVSKECRIGKIGVSPSVLLWGDSHALAWAPAIDEILRRRGMSGFLIANSACPPLFGVNNPIDMLCSSDNERVLHAMRGKHFDVIIMHASWRSYSDPAGLYKLTDDRGNNGNEFVFPFALSRTIKAIQPYAKQIMLVGPTPGAPDDIPFALALSDIKDRIAPPGRALSLVNKENVWFWREANRLTADRKIVRVDPTPWFCDGRSCRYLDESSDLLYRDGGHLSLAGARFVAGRFPASAMIGRVGAPEAAANGLD